MVIFAVHFSTDEVAGNATQGKEKAETETHPSGLLAGSTAEAIPKFDKIELREKDSQKHTESDPHSVIIEGRKRNDPCSHMSK